MPKAKPAGKKNSSAQSMAREQYQATRGPKNRRSRAEQRKKMRAQRDPRAQLTLLDQRLGTGVGAGRERPRLIELSLIRTAEKIKAG